MELTSHTAGEQVEAERAIRFVENVHGVGGELDGDVEQIVVFYPTWRSQLFSLAGFFLLCLITPLVGYYMPLAVVTGKLFDMGGDLYLLTLPIFALVPGVLLGKILITAYNSEYIIDSTGVEARIGLVGYSLRQPRLRYEDIRGVEPIQNIWERFLGIGSLLVGSAMMSEVEIVMEGIIEPRKVQQYINRRREAGRRRFEGQNKGQNS